MPKTIWKFPIQVTNEFQLEMPRNSYIIHIDVQRSSPQLWAIVDPDNPIEQRKFYLIGTGALFSNDLWDKSVYVGTFQLHSGDIVLHLFEILE